MSILKECIEQLAVNREVTYDNDYDRKSDDMGKQTAFKICNGFEFKPEEKNKKTFPGGEYNIILRKTWEHESGERYKILLQRDGEPDGENECLCTVIEKNTIYFYGNAFDEKKEQVISLLTELALSEKQESTALTESETISDIVEKMSLHDKNVIALALDYFEKKYIKKTQPDVEIELPVGGIYSILGKIFDDEEFHASHDTVSYYVDTTAKEFARKATLVVLTDLDGKKLLEMNWPDKDKEEMGMEILKMVEDQQKTATKE